MFPDLSASKSVTHNQFMQLRDSYKSDAFLNRIISPEPNRSSREFLNVPAQAKEVSPDHVHKKQKKQKRPAPL